jgi:hypothetical protein
MKWSAWSETSPQNGLWGIKISCTQICSSNRKPQIVPCDHPTIACIGSANRVKAISDHHEKLYRTRCASSDITFLRPSKIHIGLQTIHYLYIIGWRASGSIFVTSLIPPKKMLTVCTGMWCPSINIAKRNFHNINLRISNPSKYITSTTFCSILLFVNIVYLHVPVYYCVFACTGILLCICMYRYIIVYLHVPVYYLKVEKIRLTDIVVFILYVCIHEKESSLDWFDPDHVFIRRLMYHWLQWSGLWLKMRYTDNCFTIMAW